MKSILVFLAAASLAVSGCASVSAGGNSIYLPPDISSAALGRTIHTDLGKGCGKGLGGGGKHGGKCGGDMSGDLGGACIEGLASGCVDESCDYTSFFILSDMFTDRGWRYGEFPFSDGEGFYISTGGKDASVQVRGSYVAVSRAAGETPMYGICGTASFWVPSGYSITLRYLYAAEEISDAFPSTGYWHYNFFRTGIAHHLTQSGRVWATLGLFGCVLDAELGDDPYAYEEADDTGGAGIEFSFGAFLANPLSFQVTIAPAVTGNGTLTDLEALFSLHAGPLQFYGGWQSLTWTGGGEISGVLLGFGLWF
jgi:hypothetical protein